MSYLLKIILELKDDVQIWWSIARESLVLKPCSVFYRWRRCRRYSSKLVYNSTFIIFVDKWSKKLFIDLFIVLLSWVEITLLMVDPITNILSEFMEGQDEWWPSFKLHQLQKMTPSPNFWYRWCSNSWSRGLFPFAVVSKMITNQRQ